MLFVFIDKNSIIIPAKGGEITEGIIGTPRFINPLIANSEADRDLTELIFSGLMRSTATGELVPDLAESYEISEDKLQYTFHLKDAYFHDETKVTADDIIYTIEKTQDADIKSPKLSNWEGIEVAKTDDKTVVFTLPQPYAPFLQNTTLGILPKHIWGKIENSEFGLNVFNVEPIGSGPFMISKITKNNLGIAEIYSLKSFDKFAINEPYLNKINFVFVKNQEELFSKFENDEIDSIQGISPEKAKELLDNGVSIQNYTLPRIYGIFLNQTKATVFTDPAVRKALNILIPRDEITQEVFKGFAVPINSPIPNKEYAKSEKSQDELVAEAKSILEKAGWKLNADGKYVLEKGSDKKMLAFTLTTSNVPELVQTAEKTVEVWKKLGADVTLQVYQPGDFNQNIIRSRNYDAVLFGMVIGKDLDLYAFWHSSQRNDPGLNIAGYANIDTDKLLTQIRETDDLEIKNQKLDLFEKEIIKDIPAFFIYSPKFIYVLPDKIMGIEIGNLTRSDERFLNVHEWYVNTDKVLKIFNK